MSSKFICRFASGMLALGLGAILVQGAAPPAPQGVITAKGFLNIGSGTAITDLTGNAKFPDNPDVVIYEPYFEWNATGDINTAPGDYGDSYGDQMLGYFYPPTTGDYVFWIAADDAANLYLSTNDDPANKKLIAQETGWSNKRSFTAIGGGSTVEAKCSQTFTGTEWPVKDTLNGGAKITLTAGQAYYIETLHKEGGGGDGVAVSIDSALPIPGEYLASDKQSGAVTIVTQPQSVTVNEGQPARFSVVVQGTPPYTYEWFKGSSSVQSGLSASYTINRVYRADNGVKVKVVVTGAQGTATSAEATITVVNDTTAPTLVSARAVGSTGVQLTFSEPLDPTSARNAANYHLTGNVTVSAAVLGAAPGDNVVTLTTSQQPLGSTLTITVTGGATGVKDVPGNPIADGTQASFPTLVFAPGVLHRFWDNVTGNTIASLTGDSRFPDNPAWVSIEPMWEYPPNGGGEGGGNYGNQLIGWFTPPATADYVFFTCSDDPSNLYLSTDDNPANKKLIAQESGWSNPRNWVSVGGGSILEDKRSDTFANSEWPGGPGYIHLIAGQKYYMESLHTEGGGGDNVGATFINITAGDSDPVNGDAPRLNKSNVSVYLDPTGASVTISQQPQSVTTQEGVTATFTVVASATSVYGTTVTYQWQGAPKGSSTFTDISGATAASYTTGVLTPADDGRQFRVVCGSVVPTVTETSAVATLTVTSDTSPPTVVAAGSLLKGTAIEIGVLFSENVDATTAGDKGKYTLSKGSVSDVRYQAYDHADGDAFFGEGATGPYNGCAVVLVTSGLAKGDTVNLTVQGVKDIKGNAMPAQTVAVTITKKMNRAQMGGHDYVEGASTNPAGLDTTPALWPNDAVAYSESDFDLISSGTANWNNYDEAVFVYEQVTGDFDKVVRVEYQDPSSAWARAGMCATPDANEGMTRAQVEGGAMMEKRFMQRANPAVGASGRAANHQYEADWRTAAGGNYGGTGAGTPDFPNAWMRMQRTGQAFTALWSNDGENWFNYGLCIFTDTEPMPDTLLVGPYWSPEMNNGTTTANDDSTGLIVQHSVVAKFRDYGDFVSPPSKATYAIGLNFGPDDNTGSYLPSMDTAGVLVQANWNNLPTLNGSATDLVADARGVAQATSVSVTWNCANTWSSTGSRGEYNNGFSGNDRILMTGYLDSSAASTTQVTITGLPSQLTSNGYDVCVYLLGGYGGRGGGYRITDASGNTLKGYVDAQYIANPDENPQGWVQAVPTPGTWVPCNFIVFEGLTAKDIIVEATTENGHGYEDGGTTYRAPINAIQLAPKGSFVVTKPPGQITITLAAGQITITWEGDGTLQSATSVTGPWTNIGPTKPYVATVTGKAVFFRVKL